MKITDTIKCISNFSQSIPTARTLHLEIDACIFDDQLPGRAAMTTGLYLQSEVKATSCRAVIRAIKS